MAEALPLGGLLMLFGGLALIQFLVTLLLAGSPLAVVFGILAQFVLAIGAGIVLMDVVARGIQLPDQ